MTRTLTSRKGQQITTDLSDAEALRLLRTVDEKFARSVCRQAERRPGTLTREQLFHVHRTVISRGLAGPNAAMPAAAVAEDDLFRPEPVALPNAAAVFARFRYCGPRAGADFAMDGGRPVRLFVAGPRSRRPGHLQVTDGKSFNEGNVWYGSVAPDGTFTPSRHCDGDVVDFLRELFAEDARVAAALAS